MLSTLNSIAVPPSAFLHFGVAYHKTCVRVVLFINELVCYYLFFPKITGAGGESGLPFFACVIVYLAPQCLPPTVAFFSTYIILFRSLPYGLAGNVKNGWLDPLAEGCTNYMAKIFFHHSLQLEAVVLMHSLVVYTGASYSPVYIRSKSP